MATKSFEQYMRDYAASHTQRGTQLTHMVGIPMILASIPMLPLNPLLSGALFTGGWALQLAGHYFFEKSPPQFVNEPMNLLVGPVWTAVEWARLFGVELPIPGTVQAS